MKADRLREVLKGVSKEMGLAWNDGTLYGVVIPGRDGGNHGHDSEELGARAR